MRTTVLHRFILLLCLAAIGLGQALVMPRAVRCTGPTGVSRVEFACVKSDAGCCASAEPSDQADADGEHGPCRDEPAGTLVHTVKMGHSVAPLDEALTPALEIILPGSVQAASVPACPLPPAVAGTERPPDPLATLRTVILIV